MIRLIIKGNRFVANSMANERGIPFQLKNEVPPNSEKGETYSVGYVAEMRHLEKVAAWFIEDVNAKLDGKGYPLGSLLHYSFT